MQHQFWHERWERGEIGFHQDEFNSHLTTFWDKLGLNAGAEVFVPLCGKSKDMLWLKEQGYHVLGVEVNPLAVESFFKENGIDASRNVVGALNHCSGDGIEIFCGDFFKLHADHLDGVSGVFDRASLVALPPDMRRDYANHLKRIVPSNTRILLVTFEYDQEEMNGPPFSVTEAEVRGYYQDRYDISVLFDNDILDDDDALKQRGLTHLTEKVYLLQPK